MLRVTDLRDNYVNATNVYKISCSLAQEFKRTKLDGGELLVSIQGTVGRVAIVPDELAGGNVSRTLAVIPPLSSALTKWLRLSLLSPQGQHLMSEMIGGTTRDSLNLRDLRLLELPIPPLPEQKRIVAKLASLQLRSEAAKASLDAIGPLLDKFRQSVLAAAFRGDLTKAWREANPDVEPASELLERIRAERRLRWEEDNPKKAYIEPVSVDTTELQQLPKGWCWGSVDELMYASRTGLVRSAAEQRTVSAEVHMPYVRMQNFDMAGKWHLDELPFVEVSDTERRHYTLKPGDIVFNTRNSYELVGKVAVWRALDEDCVFNNNLRVFRAVSGVSAEWVGFQMQSPEFRTRIRSAKSATTSICAIYTSDILRQPVAVPPIAEQLVAISLVDKAVLRVHESSDTSAHLSVCLARMNQSILAKAFRGELVPQDPNDEPASVLLERIRAERAAAPAPARRGRRPKAAP